MSTHTSGWIVLRHGKPVPFAPFTYPIFLDCATAQYAALDNFEDHDGLEFAHASISIGDTHPIHENRRDPVLTTPCDTATH